METTIVEVFKTNVQDKEQAKELVKVLLHTFPFLDIHFDLDDCDKVLRVEGTRIRVEMIIQSLKEKGFTCEVLL